MEIDFCGVITDIGTKIQEDEVANFNYNVNLILV
jgi:hypothetical protein